MQSPLLSVPFETARRYPERISHKWKIKDATETRSYAQFVRMIRILTAGFKAAGIAKNDHVGFFVNNRFEWICTDFALMALGAVSVPRGSDTAPKELSFIFRHSDSRHLIVETVRQLEEVVSAFEPAEWDRCASIFIVEAGDRKLIPENLLQKTHFYGDLLADGDAALQREPDLVEKLDAGIKPDDLLMLSHANFVQNLVANNPRLQIDIEKAETTVVMLPSWHVYERAFEYCGIASGLTFVYSSAGRFASDLAAEKPQVLISVPRVWESVHQKLIKAVSEMPDAKRRLVLGLIKNNQAWMTSACYLKGGYISLRDRTFTAKILAAVSGRGTRSRESSSRLFAKKWGEGCGSRPAAPAPCPSTWMNSSTR
jgi:long-chain acyl-CoA synthetase